MLFNLFKKSNNRFDEVFCKNLAGLFYAVAAVDREVADEEMDFFQTTFEKDKEISKLFSKSQITLVLNEFNKLVENKANANVCFEGFQIYFKEKQTLFTSDLKSKIWKTADGIASAFAHKNKSELILLAKLKNLLLDTP